MKLWGTRVHIRHGIRTSVFSPGELKKIEQQYDIELGHQPQSRAASSVEDYPQFEQAVRIEA